MVDAAPLLEGKAQNQLDKAIDGYITLRDRRRAELDFVRTALELALSEEGLLERDKIMVELLAYVRTL